MEKLLKLNKIQQRQAGAILGAIVGDAAAGPLHWVYARQLMEKVLKNTKDWTFYKENVNEFYILECGQNTVYGTLCASMLQSIAEQKNFDFNHWKKTIYNNIGDNNSPFQIALATRYKYKEEKKQAKVPGPWIDHTMIYFVDQYKKDNKFKLGIKDSDDTDAYNATIPLTIYYAGQVAKTLIKDNNKEDNNENKQQENDINNNWDDILKQYPEKDIYVAMQLIINNENTLNRSIILSKLLWLSLLSGEQDTLKLLKYIQSQMDKNNQQNIIKEIDDVLKYANEKDHAKVCSGFGISCGMPGSFKSSLHTIITYGQNGNYKESLLQEIAAGGDNAGRSVITCSIIGSIGSVQNIPEEYVNKTIASKNVISWILELIDASWK